MHHSPPVSKRPGTAHPSVYLLHLPDDLLLEDGQDGVVLAHLLEDHAAVELIAHLLEVEPEQQWGETLAVRSPGTVLSFQLMLMVFQLINLVHIDYILKKTCIRIN